MTEVTDTRCAKHWTMLPISASPVALRNQANDWKLMANVADFHPACARAIEGLCEGLAAGGSLPFVRLIG